MQIYSSRDLAQPWIVLLQFVSLKKGGNEIGEKGCSYLSKVEWPSLKKLLLCMLWISRWEHRRRQGLYLFQKSKIVLNGLAGFRFNFFYWRDNGLTEKGCESISKIDFKHLVKIDLFTLFGLCSNENIEDVNMIGSRGYKCLKEKTKNV